MGRPKNLREAETRPGVFLFPGLWEGEIREMTTADEDALLNRRQGKEWEALNQVLQACIISPQVDVMDLLIGDRIFALLQLRRITYGDDFAFREVCPRCGAKFEWVENLGDLSVRYLEFPQQNDPEFRFEVILPKSGKKVRWKMLRGLDEPKMAAIRMARPEALMSSILGLRITDIEGEPMVTRKILADLPAYDAAVFRGEVEAKEPGVDTKITVECPNCMNAYDIEIPLGSTGFLLPSWKVTH